jgi:hypothetical protein
MDYFWFDHNSRGGSPEDELFKRLIDLFCSAEEVESSTDLEEKGPFICFVHPGYEEGIRGSDWEGMANVSRQQYVALLSFGSDPSTAVKDGSVVLLLKDRLRRGMDRMINYSTRLNAFKKSAESGKPEWQMLAPELETENLIAYYLLLLAQRKGISVDVPHELRVNAYDESQAIVTSDKSIEIALPKTAVEFDQTYLEAIGGLLKECVCK